MKTISLASRNNCASWCTAACVLGTALTLSVIAYAAGTGTAQMIADARITYLPIEKVTGRDWGNTVDVTITCKEGTIRITDVPRKKGRIYLGATTGATASGWPRGQAAARLDDKGTYSAWDSEYSQRLADGGGTGWIMLDEPKGNTLSGSWLFKGYKADAKDKTATFSGSFSQVPIN